MKAPWDNYAKPEEDGDYTDFCAWERWILEKRDVGDVIRDLEIVDRIFIYGAFVDAIRAHFGVV